MAQQFCPLIVGREAELSTLRAALTATLAGNGQCVSLIGEPGIGKSRLARQVATWAAEQEMSVLNGRAVPTSGSAAFRPLMEAMMQLFRTRALPEDRGLTPWLPLLQPLLPTLVEANSSPGEVPANLRGEALLQLLARANENGLALVLEDLHWTDADTVAVVDYLADNLAHQRILLVLTLRDSPPSAASELAGRLRGRPGATRLSLERLEEAEVASMIRACQPDVADEVLSRVAGASDGIPFLVEELLSSPGLPADFGATVTARMDALTPEQREVIQAAAVLGRLFEWQLLPLMTGQSEPAVADALAVGVHAALLASEGTSMRFRHALTRDAVLDSLLPPRQRELAAEALDALEVIDPSFRRAHRELATDLAWRAADRRLAGTLLAESGRESLAWGALSIAAESLRRAVDLLEGAAEQAAAELDLVEVLALAGRVEEAAAAGGRLVARLSDDPETVEVRVAAHLRLAQAAIAASRWQMARYHLDEARRFANGSELSGATAARLAVFEADLTLAAGIDEAARTQAEDVLAMVEATPDVRCHAYEIIGRSRRSVDLPASRAAFERALVTAEGANLAHWRLRALHELGTIDLFDHAGVDRLLQARQAADEMGALITGAILDLQLSAAFTCRWELASCDEHASSAIAIADRLGLGPVRAKALAMLTGSSSMRAEEEETERYAAMTLAAGNDDRMLEGFCWGMRAMARLMAGHDDEAIEPYVRGMAILGEMPQAEPAALRALWPLVLAARGDRRTQAAIDEARRLGVGAVSHLNRAMIGYADAVVAGRRGETRRARELAALADTGWSNCQGWADLTRVLAAPFAVADGWGEVGRWLTGAAERFAERGLLALSRRSRELLARASPNPWLSAGVSAREADVLRLLSEGLANKEIATRLYISPRTVEKHVESLLRKLGARSRTELLSRLGGARSSSIGPPTPTST